MPRPRKPLDMQVGHLTVAFRQERATEEAMVTGKRDQLAKPPKELRDLVAKKEWKRVTEVLSDIDLMGNADRTNLIGYCNAYSHYIESMKNGDADEELRWGKEMRDFEKLVYLTPDARLKAAAQKTAEKKDEIEQLFGVI